MAQVRLEEERLYQDIVELLAGRDEQESITILRTYLGERANPLMEGTTNLHAHARYFSTQFPAQLAAFLRASGLQ